MQDQYSKFQAGRIFRFNLSGNVYRIVAVDHGKREVTYRPSELITGSTAWDQTDGMDELLEFATLLGKVAQ